jgi:seryl-tRNA synthetase
VLGLIRPEPKKTSSKKILETREPTSTYPAFAQQMIASIRDSRNYRQEVNEEEMVGKELLRQLAEMAIEQQEEIQTVRDELVQLKGVIVALQTNSTLPLSQPRQNMLCMPSTVMTYLPLSQTEENIPSIITTTISQTSSTPDITTSTLPRAGSPLLSADLQDDRYDFSQAESEVIVIDADVSDDEMGELDTDTDTLEYDNPLVDIVMDMNPYENPFEH